MSISKQTIRAFVRFIKLHGYSQHHAAEVLGISQPSLSKLLNGITTHISDASLTDTASKMQAWIDDVQEAESRFYQRLRPFCVDIPKSVARNVFTSILQDM